MTENTPKPRVDGSWLDEGLTETVYLYGQAYEIPVMRESCAKCNCELKEWYNPNRGWTDCPQHKNTRRVCKRCYSAINNSQDYQCE